MFMFDTIAAAATPPLTGAIAIVRISGKEAFAVADRVFKPYAGGTLSSLAPRHAWYGEIRDADGSLYDRCLALTFPGPHSYTGEDCAELQCHGGLTLVSKVLELCMKAGARAAQPGEFTRRAFLNGKMDLTGAEAVADLISAESAEGIKNAAAQLNGRLAATVNENADRLTETAAHFSAYIDYTEEGVEPPDMGACLETLRQTSAELQRLSDSFSEGRCFSEGVSCALIGRPNAGKSSLLNLLAGRERSIVTDIPGTTRDTVEATVNIGGVLLRLIDTAGLRETADRVEQIGVSRSRNAAETASLVLALYDLSEPLTPEDAATDALAAECPGTVIRVYCKQDLTPAYEPDPEGVVISSVTGAGLEELKQKIMTALGTGAVTPDGSLVTNRRQADALGRAARAAAGAADAIEAGFTPDVAWVSVSDALSALGEVTGRNVSADVLDRVFARFCVGK